MSKEKMKTTELLDAANKEGVSDVDLQEIEKELNDRSPFAWIESRFEDTDDGLRKKIEDLEGEVSNLKELIRKHKHIESKVVVDL